MSQKLKQHIGDSVMHGIPLHWKGRRFTPGGDWTLILSCKADPDNDADADSLFQKTTGSGITHSGDDALVEVVPDDTRTDPATPPGTYYWGIMAQHNSTGERRHVATGTLELIQALTIEDDTVIPIYTTNPPASSMLTQISGASDADPLDGTELFGAVRSGSLFSTTLTKIKVFVLDSLTIAWGSITGKPSTFPPDSHTHPTADLTDATANANSNPEKVLKTTAGGGLTLATLTVVGDGFYDCLEAGNTSTKGTITIHGGNLYRVAFEPSVLTDDVLIMLPTDNGTMARTEDIDAHAAAADPHGDRAYADTNFIPYTGATMNVNLGAHSVTTTDAMYASDHVATGSFSFYDGVNTGQFVCPDYANDPVWTMQNTTGTVALLDDIPTSFSATGIDFAGSTDIGAALADADEIIVSDGGGNTTRRKSAVSRIWTYIKAKIDAGQTWAGTQTFSAASVFSSGFSFTGTLTGSGGSTTVNTQNVSAQRLYSSIGVVIGRLEGSGSGLTLKAASGPTSNKDILIPDAAATLINDVSTQSITGAKTFSDIRIPTSTPASAAASGTAGQIVYDSNYIYVCVAANTWKRAALATW